MVGEPAFEHARGVLMEAYQCTAATALTLIEGVTDRRDTNPADLIRSLCSAQPNDEVRTLFAAEIERLRSER